MGLLSTIIRRLKGLGDAPYADDSHWRPLSGGGTRILLPGSNQDWRRRAGVPWLNSAAWIGINWIAQSCQEAPICVVTDGAGGQEYDTQHPLCALWNRPNATYSGGALTSGVVLSLLADGNAYIQKVRGRAGSLGPPVELYWLPHWRMEPVSDKGSTRLVDRYELSMPDGSKQTFELTEIVHIRYGLDPENARKGISPLKPVLREIASDNEAATFVAAMLANMGVPGLVVSTKDPTLDIPEHEAERLKELIWRRTTGDERGKPIVIPAPIQLDTIGLTPGDLALTELLEQSICRILAAMGLSAMAVGLPDSQRTYANYAEALRAAWDNGVAPLMAIIGDALDVMLLPDYKPAPGQHVEFDLSRVQALQEDVNALHLRARQNYVAGVWTRAEARMATGAEVREGDDVYIDQARAMAAVGPEPEAPASKGVTVKATQPDEETSPWVERILAEIAALDASEGQPPDEPDELEP